MADRECDKYADMIFDYVEGGLSPEQAAELEAHISACPDCSALVNQVKETSRLIKDSKYSAPPELLQGVMDSVRGINGVRKTRTDRRRTLRRLASAAAALLVVCGIAVSLRSMTNSEKSAASDKSEEDYVDLDLNGDPASIPPYGVEGMLNESKFSSGYAKGDDPSDLNYGDFYSPEETVRLHAPADCESDPSEDDSLVTKTFQSTAEEPARDGEEDIPDSFGAVLMLKGAAYALKSIDG